MTLVGPAAFENRAREDAGSVRTTASPSQLCLPSLRAPPLRYNAAVSSGDHAGQGIVYPELASTHGTLVRGLHEIARCLLPSPAQCGRPPAPLSSRARALTLISAYFRAKGTPLQLLYGRSRRKL